MKPRTGRPVKQNKPRRLNRVLVFLVGLVMMTLGMLPIVGIFISNGDKNYWLLLMPLFFLPMSIITLWFSIKGSAEGNERIAKVIKRI